MTTLARINLLSVVLLCLGNVLPTASAAPPNWRLSATGTTRPEGGVDVDELAGRSTHLGRFTGAGFHVLNPLDFTFVGEATWTAANGDGLFITYVGQVFLSDDPDFPFGFVADVVAAGGTGRFAKARGSAVMSGGFTGVPGNFYLSLTGTLHPKGK